MSEAAVRTVGQHAGKERTRALLVVLLCAAALARVSVLTSTWDHDCGAWLLISRAMNEGRLPYDDLWDNKLPPIYWLGQLFLASGFPHVTMFLFEVAATVAAALGLAAFLRSAGASARLALFFGGLSVAATLPAWEGPHRIELYAVACLAWGLALAARLPGTARAAAARLALASGALLAAAAAFHPQQALIALLLAPAVAALAGPERVVSVAAYAAGGLLVTGLLALSAALGGYFEGMLREAVLGSLSYGLGEATPGASMLGKTLAIFARDLERLSLAWSMAGGGAVLLGLALDRLQRPGRVLGITAATVFTAHVMLTFLAGHQWMHYHFPSAWSACLLGGTGWAAWLGLERREREGWPAAGLLCVALAAVVPFSGRVYSGVYALLRSRPEERSDRVETFLRANVPADQGVLLVDMYDALGTLVRLPNPLGSRWAVGAPQYMYGDPEAARTNPDPWVDTATRWGTLLLERIDAEAGDWVLRERGRQDRLTLVLAQSFDPVAQTDELVLYRRRAR